jgi:hypothetical protein
VSAPPLFRPEAVRARAESAFGPVRIGLPPPLRWLAAGVVVAAAMGLGWATLASFTRTLALPGTLQPVGGLIALRAGVHGSVLEVPAHEGQSLADGAIVVVVDTAGPSAGGATRVPVSVTAPQPVRISTLPARPGQPVAPSTVVAHLEPAVARWQAELTAPAFALGALADGRVLRLRLLDAAGSDPVWLDGRVSGVAREPQRAPIGAARAPSPAGPATSASPPLPAPPVAVAPPPPFYRVTVVIDTHPADLRSGLRVQAVLPLEQRRMLDWLFGGDGAAPG